MAFKMGGKSRKSRRRSVSAEINVTPLVDVMLVLLVIFMATAPMLSAGVPVDIPESDAGAIHEDDQGPIEVSLTGTGLVYACLAPLVDIVGTFQRKPDYENRGIDDAGTNYFGFATGKLAQSIRTDADSSHAEVRRGESGAPGALIRQRIATAFSGGTIEQDIMIAQAGIDQFERLPVTREFVSSLTIDEHDTVVLDYLKRRGYFSSLLRNGMLGTLTDRVRTRAREQSLTPLDLDQAVELYWPEDIAGVLEKYKKIAPAGK